MDTLLVFLGLCKDVLTYPSTHASYPIPVRQFRLLPFGLLQCIPHGKPPCHLLILQDVTPAYKGLSPSGLVLKSSLKNFYYIYHSRHTHVVKNIGVDDATARFSLTTKLINSEYESSR